MAMDAFDYDDGDGRRGERAATASTPQASIIRNRPSASGMTIIDNDIADPKKSAIIPQAPQSGKVPSPTGGVRSFSEDGVNHRIFASPSLRHRHHLNQQRPRRQPSVGTNSMENDDDNVQQQFKTIQGSQSLDDADIAAGATKLRAMELLASPSQLNHQLGTGNGSTWVTSPSSRSLGSHTPTSFSRRPDRFEIDHGQPMECVDKRHYLYGGSEHDFLALSSENDTYYEQDDNDGEQPVEGRYPQQQPLHQQHDLSYGLPNANAGKNSYTNEDAEYFTALLPPSKQPQFSLDENSTSLSNTATKNATTMSFHFNTPLPKFTVLGWDLTTYSRRSQFIISAGGTYLFSLVYGYLQELISVTLCNRKLGLFLALAQFAGYTILSYFFRRFDMSGGGDSNRAGNAVSIAGGGGGGTTFFSRKFRRLNNWGKLRGGSSSSTSSLDPSTSSSRKSIPIEFYIGLSVLRAIDLGMTNLAMQYVNYPAKTIMKSTRVVFTMLFGVIVSKKRYGIVDFGIVSLMVAGLGMFMHADANTSAVFQPIGIVMLVISLLGDGAISNLSEALMNQYEVGQDEFIFRLYSIATFFICIAAVIKGDLRDGLAYLTRPGTLKEIEDGLVPTWSILSKILTMALFSTTGFLGSSCSAAITKTFGALTMSITSTARKATTIFLSFALFPSNKCTLEHVGGIILFIASLVAKSVRESKRTRNHYPSRHPPNQYSSVGEDNYPAGMRPPVVMGVVNVSGGGGGSMRTTSSSSRKSSAPTFMGSPLLLRHKISGHDAV